MSREYYPLVQNVVCKASTLKNDIDKDDVAWGLHARLDTDVFPATFSVVREAGGVRIAIFQSNGQLVISGARSEEQALLSVHLLVAKMNEVLHRTDLRVHNFSITNIVASVETGFGIDLSLFCDDDQVNRLYDKNKFNGLNWSHTFPPGPGIPPCTKKTPRVGFIVFETGRVVMTGLWDMRMCQIVANELRVLEKYEAGKTYIPMEQERAMIHKKYTEGAKRSAVPTLDSPLNTALHVSTTPRAAVATKKRAQTSDHNNGPKWKYQREEAVRANTNDTLARDIVLGAWLRNLLRDRVEREAGSVLVRPLNDAEGLLCVRESTRLPR
jgi:TATA-box binding protein (TBP) (component of TFIID and TFIIIB)